jgi:hypothetical protein
MAFLLRMAMTCTATLVTDRYWMAATQCALALWLFLLRHLRSWHLRS